MELEDGRLSLDINSPCCIFSRSKQEWLEGIVSKILVDSTTNQEWLVVKYGNNKSKKIQRFCKDIRSTNFIKRERIYGFEELQPPPFDIHIGNQYSNIICINPMEFAIATEMIPSELGTYGSFVGGIYVYSVIVNNWMLLREYPSKIPFLKSTQLSLTFNTNTNELYIYGIHENALYSILAKLNIYTRKFKYTICKSYNAGIGATALIIDGRLHLIGGAVSNKHAIYNEETKNFDIKYDIWNEEIGNTKHSVIHNINTSMLLVLGGGHGNGKRMTNIDEIWAHDLSGTYYHLTPDAAWNKLNIRMPYGMSSFGCCLCFDKFVIIFCDNGMSSDIMIMNINKISYEIYDNKRGKYNAIEGKSKLELPLSLNNIENKYNAIMLPICPDYDSDLMVVGYIKNYIYRGYNEYISSGISNLIYAFSETEYIFLMQQETIKPKLWRICVDDIFNSIITV